MNELYTVYHGDELVAENVTFSDAADYIWSEDNTEGKPIRVFDSNGREIEY